MCTASDLITYFLKKGISVSGNAANFELIPKSSNQATTNSVFFVSSVSHLPDLMSVIPCLVIMPEEGDVPVPDGLLIVRVTDPRATFFEMVRELYVFNEQGSIHPSASIHHTAKIGRGVTIQANCVIGPGCQIGDRTVLRAGVHLFRSVSIGADCLVKSNTVIGDEGFGVYPNSAGINQYIPHTGGVVIGDNVVVGALCTICSGTLDPTIIGNHTMMDDHIHVAHNCVIGENVIITACAELSGSVTVEKNVWIGPQCAIMNKVTIGSNALLGLGAVIRKSVPEKAVMAGNPARVLRYVE